MGYLGYDVIREVERLPNVPHDDHGLPDAVMSVIGSLAAFDHWRQRVYMIESVPTHGLSPEQLDAAYDAAAASVAQGVENLARPLPYVPVEPPRVERRVAGGPVVDAGRALPEGGRGGQGVHPRRRHLPGRARPALRPDARRRPVRRVPRAAAGESEPVHVLPPPRRDHHRRLVARTDGAAARPQGDLAADRRDATAWTNRRGRSPDGRRVDRAPEGTRRARDAGRPRPQRRRAGGAVRERARRRADDARALQPRDAPDVTGVG